VVDPIWLSAHVLSALYAIPSRLIAPLQPCVVSVGIIQGGSAENVIPDEVYLEGTLRSYDDEVRETLIQEVERALNLARNYGGDYRLKIERGYPVNFNDPQVSGWVRQVGGDLLGEAQVGSKQRSMGSEDFGYMTRLSRGAMFRLGVKKPGSEDRYLHTSTFDLDEDALPVGAAVLAETALRFVRQQLS
jgi:amidohydrolase